MLQIGKPIEGICQIWLQCIPLTHETSEPSWQVLAENISSPPYQRSGKESPWPMPSLQLTQWAARMRQNNWHSIRTTSLDNRYQSNLLANPAYRYSCSISCPHWGKQGAEDPQRSVPFSTCPAPQTSTGGEWPCHQRWWMQQTPSSPLTWMRKQQMTGRLLGSQILQDPILKDSQDQQVQHQETVKGQVFILNILHSVFT